MGRSTFLEGPRGGFAIWSYQEDWDLAGDASPAGYDSLRHWN